MNNTIKLNKLYTALEKHKGAQKTLMISTKDVDITITGEIHKIDDQYYLSRGAGRVVVEQQKAGRLLSWRGTYKKYVVKFIIGQDILAQFEIPAHAKLSFDNTDVPDET